MIARSSVHSATAPQYHFKNASYGVQEDFTINCDKLGLSLLSLRKYLDHISGTLCAESKSYTGNNAEQTGKPSQRLSFAYLKQELEHRLLSSF